MSEFKSNSRRYCLYCKKMTQFAYNRRIFHSECTVCGCRAAHKHPPEGGENE